MRDLLLQQLSPDNRREENLNFLRESLQIILLKILHESSTASALAFTGGTALRLLHQLARFSEDLDFSLVDAGKYNMQRMAVAINKALSKLSLPVELKIKDAKNVHHVVVLFKELLYDANLSPHREQKLPIRIEIDVNPPAGWQTAISLLSRIYTFPVQHFDLPSMFATKLHACLYRRYAKGRDFYDLMWYIGKKVKPNLIVLRNAIRQTERIELDLTNNILKKMLIARISNIDVARLRRDVEPFLLHSQELDLLNPDLMQQVVSGCQFFESP